MVQNALASFGAGKLFATPTLLSGVATPIEFAILQEVSLDFSFTTKPLYGSNQHAVFVARSEAKFTGKAKYGVMSGNLIANLFFGATPTAGQVQEQTDAKAVPASTPYTLTITPPNTGTFVADLGVTYAATGVEFIAVASGPTQGQYMVNAATGVYTFAAADASAGIMVNYTYTSTTTGAQKIAITNNQMGTTPYFSMVLRERDPRSGTFNTLSINRATSEKLSLASKYNDYTIPEFDFLIMDDGTGNIGTWSFGDNS